MSVSTACLRRCALAVLCCIGTAAAAEHVVAPSGSDSASGTEQQPLRTINAAIRRAQPGDTVWVRAGTYREALTISNRASASAPITIAGWPGERPMIKGSQHVTGWTYHGGGVWKRTGWTIRPQQVFASNTLLRQIGWPAAHYQGRAADGSIMYTPVGSGLSSMTPGTFWYDAGARVLYVRLPDESSDPNSATMEVSTARHVVNMTDNARQVHLQNLSFRHSNTTTHQQIGGGILLGSDCSLRNCDVQWMDFAGISFGWQRSGASVVDCTVLNNGNMGISIDKHSNFRVARTTIAYNNQRKFNPQWAAGGIKATTGSWGTVEHVVAASNRGPGIWFDYCLTGNPIIVRHCDARNNFDKSAGIIAECAKNVTIANNLVTGNDRRGVYISASNDVRLVHNTIVGNVGFAAVDIGGMPRSGRSLTNIQVRNNIISGNRAEFDLRVLRENGTDIRTIRIQHNLIHRDGALSLWYGRDARGGWAASTASNLTTWRSISPHGSDTIGDAPRFAVGADSDYRLASDSPAIDRAAWVAETIDRDGVSRPQGPACDLGACEAVR